jgi:hypothetical protein
MIRDAATVRLAAVATLREARGGIPDVAVAPVAARSPVFVMDIATAAILGVAGGQWNEWRLLREKASP